MTSTNLAVGFAHRHNTDGTFDSICYTCFMTVATEASELELIEAEQDHDCYDLARKMDFASRGKALKRFEQRCPRPLIAGQAWV